MERGSGTPAGVYSMPKPVWHNILFFSFTAIMALTAAPVYWIQNGGISAATAALAFFYLVATGISITAGYHRLYAHAAYKACLLYTSRCV